MLCARVGNIVSLKDNGGSQDVPRKPAVLFVCLGNICRSPLAEAAFRAEVVRIGLDVEVDSAGTGDWHVGKPPDPRRGELRLRLHAFGLNRAEAMFHSGKYLEQPKLPGRLGYEAAGTVEATGEGVTGFAIGDKVSTIPAFSMNQYGVYGEQRSSLRPRR
jgi:hypothetical protein